MVQGDFRLHVRIVRDHCYVIVKIFSKFVAETLSETLEAQNPNFTQKHNSKQNMLITVRLRDAHEVQTCMTLNLTFSSR